MIGTDVQPTSPYLEGLPGGLCSGLGLGLRSTGEDIFPKV